MHPLDRTSWEVYGISDPTPHPRLVPGVLLAEETPQVPLLAFDDPALNEDEDEGEQEGGG